MKITTTALIISLCGSAVGVPVRNAELDAEKRSPQAFRNGGSSADLPLPTNLGSLGLGGSGIIPSGLPFPSGLPLPSGLPFPSGLPIPSGFGNLGGLGNLGDLGSLLGGLGGSSSSDLDSLLSGLKARDVSVTRRESPQGGTRVTRRAGSITENGVTDKDACQPLTLIFARGTSELGNMGSVVGPPLASALRSLTNNSVTVQGVDYPASIEGNALLGASGGPTMASLVKQALSQCPNTKVVLGGYSQGAMVVHNAASSLSADQVKAAVLFGDPFKAEAVGSIPSANVKEFCAEGDPVCLNGANVLAHLSYGDDAQTAAQFLVQATGV